MFTLNPIKDKVIAILCDTCVKITKSVVGIDTMNWMKLSGNIIANGSLSKNLLLLLNFAQI